MRLLDSVNTWIAGHQALVVAVGLPLLTAMVSAIMALWTNKSNLQSQAQSRELQQRLKVYDASQQRIEKFRTAVMRFEKVIFCSKLDAQFGLSAGFPDHLSKDSARSLIDELIAARIELVLFVDPTDPELGALEAAISENPFSDARESGDHSTISLDKKFISVCRRIIFRMESKAMEALSS